MQCTPGLQLCPTQTPSFLLYGQIQIGLQLLIWLMRFLAFLCTQILSIGLRFSFKDKIMLKSPTIFADELGANLLSFVPP
jgi:hypothetical protein